MTRDPVKLMLAQARRQAKSQSEGLKSTAYIIRLFAQFHNVLARLTRRDRFFLFKVENGNFQDLEYEDVQAQLKCIQAEVAALAGEPVRYIGAREWKRRDEGRP
jgi:hypothetical protein